jgi:ABC-type branched-subunit amino acid transport system ATPase component
VTPLLSVEDVHVRLWRGSRSLQVLDGVSLQLEAGSLGGVWADRSAGKTTLSRLLDGEEVVDGAHLDARLVIHPAIGLARRLGPAMPELPIGTWIAQSMIASCRWPEAVRQAAVALDRVGAGHLGAERWSRLADSERTLVAIAYAIARGPRLLVVDDLVAGLGPWRREVVLSLLHDIAANGVAVLMTSAEVGDFKGAQRIWSLEAGRLIESAPRPGADVLPLRPTGSTPAR